MAYLISKKIGKGGNPVLGALTGLMGGLSQGITNAERIKALRAGTRIDERRQSLFERREASDEETKKGTQEAIQGLLALKLSMMGGQGQQAQLPMEPRTDIGPPQGPSPGGAPMQAPDPSEARHAQWQASLQAIAPKIKSKDALEAFLAIAQQEESLRVTGDQAQRLRAELETRRDQGIYQQELAPDLQAGADARLEELLALDDEPNPAVRAKRIDEIRDEDEADRRKAAQSATLFRQRQQLVNTYGSQLEQRATAGAPTDEAEALFNQYSLGLVDDEAMSKLWPSALNGQLAISMQLKEAQTEATLARTFMASPEGMQFQARLKAEAEGQRQQGRMDIEGVRQQGRLGAEERKFDRDKELVRLRAQLGKSGTKPADRNKEAERILNLASKDFRYMAAQSDEERRAVTDSILAQRASIAGQLGGEEANGQAASGDSAKSIMDDLRSKKITPEEAKKRAAALGLNTPEALKAAVGP